MSLLEENFLLLTPIADPQIFREGVTLSGLSGFALFIELSEISNGAWLWTEWEGVLWGRELGVRE